MSSHRKNNNPLVGLAFVVFVGMVFVFEALNAGGGPGDFPASPETSFDLREALKPPAAAPSKEGTAVMVVVDTSGSMKEPVIDADGKSRPKIEIARRSLSVLLGKIAEFTAAHPDKTVVVGMAEFSGRNDQPNCRIVLPLGTPQAAAAQRAIDALQPLGGTPIGDAMVEAKRILDAAGYKKTHILVVTDGENTLGEDPGVVAKLLSELPEEHRASLYFVAFDVAADKFSAVKATGALVMEAAGETQLRETFDYILSGKILVEQPQ